jgi:hypothetical protein
MVERDIQKLLFPRSKRYIAMPPVAFVLYIWWARRSRPTIYAQRNIYIYTYKRRRLMGIETVCVYLFLPPDESNRNGKLAHLSCLLHNISRLCQWNIDKRQKEKKNAHGVVINSNLNFHSINRIEPACSSVRSLLFYYTSSALNFGFSAEEGSIISFPL